MTKWAYGNDERPYTFIQWKGTDLCADFFCICGDQFHVDAEFAYAVQCPHCQRRYELSLNVELRELSSEEVWEGCEIVLGSAD